ncbi:hypothetical protein ACSQ67_025027 [Phaseolus vulgaris]
MVSIELDELRERNGDVERKRMDIVNDTRVVEVGGMGRGKMQEPTDPHKEATAEDKKPITSCTAWYRTDSSMTKLIFDRRMLEYPCLTQDPLLAKARGHNNGVV